MRRTITELLEELRQLDESERLEAKLANEIGPAVTQTICAFANEPGLGGGTLLLGVEKDEGADSSTYRVVGVRDPDRLQRDLVGQCRSVFSRPVDVDVWVEQIEGGAVVAVNVHESTPGEKPIFVLKVGLPKGAYRRKGSADVSCTEHEIRELFASSQAAEDVAVTNSDWDDIDEVAVREYRRRLAEVNPSSEVLQLPDEDIVRSLGGLTREAGGLIPTLAGVLLFGKQPSLRRLLPMVRVDYIRVPGTTWVPDANHRFAAVEIRAPLLLAYQRAYTTILDDLPKTFSLPEGSPHGRGDPPIPERVIREALANCLIHRNYRVHQPTQIIRYTNRIEMLNPGYSLIDESLLGAPGSRTRNPRISAVFHDLQLAENKGTGIQAMRREMKQANLALPTFESDRENDLFKATLWLHHLLGDQDRTWLASFRRLSLSNDEVMALVHAREMGNIRNETLRQLTGLDTLAASKVLARLRNERLLETQGQGSATYYKPTERLLSPERFPELALAPTSSPKAPPVTMELPFGDPVVTAPLPPEARQLPPEARQLPPEARQLPPEARQLPPEARQLPPETGEFGLPLDLIEELANAGRRGGAVRKAILAACAISPLRPRDLAKLLRRKDAERLVTQYLAPMVDERLLERTHPKKLTHPDQAYRTRQ